MINTLKLSNLLFNKILIAEQKFLIVWFDSILLSFKITQILLHKTKKNLENISKEPSNAIVMNIKT